MPEQHTPDESELTGGAPLSSADNRVDEDTSTPEPRTELGPEGKPTGDVPEGVRWHDELANTDHRVVDAQTSAPVSEGVPQGHGFTEPGPEAGDAENLTGGDPLSGPTDTSDTEGESTPQQAADGPQSASPVVDDPQTPARKRTARKGS